MKSLFLSRKEEIVLTTISLIHELGVNHVSMKEIGRKEGVTEASLYKHFKNKEELLSAVLEYYEQYDEHIYLTLKNKQSDSADNLFQYFIIYADYYNNYKEITSLMNTYDVLSHDECFAERGKEIIETKINFLEELIGKGQKDGELKQDIIPKDLAYLLLGTFNFIITMWRLQKYSFPLTDKVKEIIGNVLKNCTVQNNN